MPASGLAGLFWEGMDCLCGRGPAQVSGAPFSHLLPPGKEQLGSSHTQGPWGSLLMEPVAQSKSKNNTPRGKAGRRDR